MAQYDVTYSCGHTGTIQIFGPTKDRERKAEWIGGHKVCADCWAKWRGTEEEYEARKAANAAKNATAAIINADQGRIPLVGTDAQVAWAETLRADLMAEADKIMQALAEHPLTGEDGEEINRLYPLWYIEVMTQESAQWWIDHRYETRDGVMSSGNPMAMFGVAMTGRTPKIDVAGLFRVWRQEKRAADKIAAIPKPERPAFMAAWGNGQKWTWNGKIYGNPKYGPVRIYLQIGGDRDGIEVKLSSDEAEQLQNYMAAKAAYKAACAEVPAAQSTGKKMSETPSTTGHGIVPISCVSKTGSGRLPPRGAGQSPADIKRDVTTAPNKPLTGE